MKKIEAYETIDGILFTDKDKAEKHENLHLLECSIINLLGGSDNDIDKGCNFINGDGYYIVPEENMDKAKVQINELLKATNQKGFSITSRACNENKYTNSVGNTMACIVYNENIIKRVGQPYFANNLHKIGSKIYT